MILKGLCTASNLSVICVGKIVQNGRSSRKQKIPLSSFCVLFTLVYISFPFLPVKKIYCFFYRSSEIPKKIIIELFQILIVLNARFFLKFLKLIFFLLRNWNLSLNGGVWGLFYYYVMDAYS